MDKLRNKDTEDEFTPLFQVQSRKSILTFTDDTGKEGSSFLRSGMEFIVPFRFEAARPSDSD